MVARFGGAEEPALREQVGKSLVNKGAALGELKRHEEEIAVYDEVAARFGGAEEPALREIVAKALQNRSVALVHRWREKKDRAFLEEALDSARKAVSLGSWHYNLACALALSGKTDEAFEELEGCLERGEIAWSHVDGDTESKRDPDPDWNDLRAHPRYLALRARYRKE